MAKVEVATVDFEANLLNASVGQNRFRSQDYRGSWVLLVFLPDTSLVSPGDVFQFSDRKGDFQNLNCDVFIATCDESERVEARIARSRALGGFAGLSIPIVFGVETAVAEQCGLFKDGRTALASVVLIGPEGVIRYQSSQLEPGTPSQLLRVLHSLQNPLSSFTYEPTAASTSTDQPPQEDVEETVEFGLEATQTVQQRITQALRTASGWVVGGVTGTVTAYQQQLTERPLWTKSLTSAVLAALGEVVGSQLSGTLLSGGVLSLVRRVVVFFTYGLCLAGPFFHFWYAALFRYVSSLNLPHSVAFLLQLLLNQLVMTPPFLIVTLSFLQLSRTHRPRDIYENLRTRFLPALWTNWRVWTVAQAINFSLVPLEYRVLFGNLVALWWNVFLSLATGNATSK